MCKILAGLRRTSLGAHLLPPPSVTHCGQASSAVFCVAVCACSSSSSCPQLHLHHGQGRQTLWKKCCNAEKGPRGGRESQPRNKTKDDGRRELQEDELLRRAHACHGIRGSGHCQYARRHARIKSTCLCQGGPASLPSS